MVFIPDQEKQYVTLHFRQQHKLKPNNRLRNCFFLKIAVKNSKILELQKKTTGGIK